MIPTDTAGNVPQTHIRIDDEAVEAERDQILL